MSDSAPQALQAVKLLAQYTAAHVPKVSSAALLRCAGRCPRCPLGACADTQAHLALHYVMLAQDAALDTVRSWLADPICSSNPTVLLVAGLLFLREGDCVEALKACHGGQTLELCVVRPTRCYGCSLACLPACLVLYIGYLPLAHLCAWC